MRVIAEISYKDFMAIKDIEQAATDAGFKLAKSSYSGGVSLIPLGDNFPVYSRNADLFCGNLRDIQLFLEGIKWAKQYYGMLKLVDDKKIAKREQIVRNRELINLLKGTK